MMITQASANFQSSTASRLFHMNFLIWNIQGAGNTEAINILREHINKHRPHIIALIETRISGVRAQITCDKISYRNCFRVEAQGLQGGIWVLWNADELEVKVLNSQTQCVTVEITSPGRLSWLLTCVYASPHPQIRETLWQRLESFAATFHKPWLLVGDFNETISLDERNHRGPEMQRRCRRFKHWIDNNGLVDLGFSGPKFTWARGLTQAIRKEACLDSAFCNMDWRLKFPNGAVCHLIQAGSDHSPLLISTSGFMLIATNSKPFRFQVAWVSHQQFEKVIKTNWTSSNTLVPKLKDLATALSTWNKDIFGNLFQRKRKLWERIKGIQRRLATGAPRYLLKLERKLSQELDHTFDQIAMLLI